MTMLVTGSDGLVGSALKKLNPRGAVFVARKDADLTDFNQTKALFAKVKPTRVLHLAAEVAGVGGNLIHSGEYFRNNMLINMNVLESARIHGAKKLISFMSTCVFPEKCEFPLNERSLHAGPPHPSNFGYAYAKRMLEVQSSAYRKEWGCNFVVAIPTNIYGPNDYWNLKEGHVVPSLIHKVFLAKRERKPLQVWGSGAPLREFVLSTDIAKLSLWALDHYDEDSPIILSSGVETSIRELVSIVSEEMAFEGEIVFDSTKPDGQFRKPSDTNKLKRYLPEFNWTPLRDGIRETVAWFNEHYPEIRQ